MLIEKPITIKENESISKALGKFKEGIDMLVVVDEKGNYRGIITKNRLLKQSINPKKTLIKHFVIKAPTVENYDDLKKIAKLILESGSKGVVVIKNGKIEGVISDINLLYYLKDELKGLTAENICVKDVICIGRKDPIGKALAMMKANKISRLPVIDEEGKLVGIVSLQDIITSLILPKTRPKLGELAGEKVDSLSVPVENIMNYPVISVLPKEKGDKIVELMKEKKVSSVVVARGNRIVGIITKRDLLGYVSAKEDEKLDVQVIGRLDSTSGLEKNLIVEEVSETLKTYISFLKEISAVVDIKPYSKKYKTQKIYHAKIRVKTPLGVFVASADGISPINATRMALFKLERIVLKERKMLLEESRRLNKEELVEDVEEIL